MQDLTAWARSVFNSILNSINLVVGGTLNQKLLEPIVTNFLGSLATEKDNKDVKDDESENKDGDKSVKSSELSVVKSLFPTPVIDKSLDNSKRGLPVACATDSNLNLVQIRNKNGLVSGFDISTDLDNGGFWDNPPSFEVPAGLNPYGFFDVKSAMSDLAVESNFLSQSLPIQQHHQNQPSSNSKYVMRRAKANSLSRPYPYLSHQHEHQPQTTPIQQGQVSHVPQSSFLDLETTYATNKCFDTFSPEFERHPSPPGYYSPDETTIVSEFPDTSFSQNQQHSNLFTYDSVSSVSSVSPMEQPISEPFVAVSHDPHCYHYPQNAPSGHPVMVHGVYPLVHSRANSEMGCSPGDNVNQTLCEVDKPVVDDLWAGLLPSAATVPASSGDACLVFNGANSQQFIDVDNTAASFQFSSASLIMEGVSPQSSIVSIGSSHQSNSVSQSDCDDSPQSMYSGSYSLEDQQQDNGKADMQFICPYCEAGFKIKGYLTRHVKKHALEKAYTCPFFHAKDETPCHPNGGFSRRDTYKTHLKARHFEYPPGTRSEHRSKVGGSCKGCGQRFSSNEEWVEQHIQGHQCSGLSTSRKRQGLNEETKKDNEGMNERRLKVLG